MLASEIKVCRPRAGGEPGAMLASENRSGAHFQPAFDPLLIKTVFFYFFKVLLPKVEILSQIFESGRQAGRQAGSRQAGS